MLNIHLKNIERTCFATFFTVAFTAFLCLFFNFTFFKKHCMSHDPYKCIKIPLKCILSDYSHVKIIDDAVQRTHRFVIKAFQLVKLWILDYYHSNRTLPIINKDTFITAFKVINLKSRKCSSSIFNEMSSLYTFDKENGEFLTQVLNQYAPVEMLTSFENNIKQHFFDYVCRFINSVWKNYFKKEIENGNLKLSTLKKELRKVKNDLLFQTDTCDEKYKQWIKDNRIFILPSNLPTTHSYKYDLEKNPQNYFKHMIWMNIELEKINGKMFQCFPLRNNCIPKFFHFDNTTLIKLLVDESLKPYYLKSITEEKKLLIKSLADESLKSYLFKNITEEKKFLWTTFFHIKYIEDIKIKNYYFDYAFSTDGYSASLRFIHNDELIKQNGLQEKKRKGRQETKGLTKEQRKKRQQKKENNIKTEEKNKPIKYNKKSDKSEFTYFDDIDINSIKNRNIVVVDPGKRDLMTMMNMSGEKLTYSNRERIHYTKRLKYQRHLKNVKDSLGITKDEENLTNFNSKSCDMEKYKEFIDEKNKTNKNVLEKYQDLRFRQYSFYSYVNEHRANAKMIKKIENKYGKNCVIIHGDWSQGKQMSNFMSTPNLGIKREIAKHFELYNIDEYNTSKLHHQTEEKCINLKLPDKKGKIRKMHAVLMYKTEKGRIGCINRDLNSCKNMVKIVKHYIQTGERIERYQRKRVSNPPKERQVDTSSRVECKGS